MFQPNIDIKIFSVASVSSIGRKSTDLAQYICGISHSLEKEVLYNTL
jgi:hypothetical protein